MPDRNAGSPVLATVRKEETKSRGGGGGEEEEGVGGWVKGDQRSWFGGDGVGGWIWRLEPVSKREEIWEEEEEKGV